jgi:hypothetical protein
MCPIATVADEHLDPSDYTKVTVTAPLGVFALRPQALGLSRRDWSGAIEVIYAGQSVDAGRWQASDGDVVAA